MSGLTKDGFVIKRYDEILKEINEDLINTLGVNIDTSVNSVAGIYNSIMAKQLASLWELGQNVYDGGDLLKAEGEQLDNLALLQGILRESAKATRGIAWFRGEDGTQLTANTLMTSLAGDSFLPEVNFSISSSNSIETTFEVALVVPLSVYQVTIDGAIYTYTSSGSDTAETIRDQLHTKLLVGSGLFSAEKFGSTQVKIVANDKSNPLNVSGTSYLTFSEVLTPAIIVSQELGYISGDALAIVNISTPVNGWESVSNPTDLNLGRNQETDEDLRSRILETYSTVGSGTPSTILQRVLEVPNVQSAVLYENVKWQTDTTLVPNLPPKSYTLTVHDGDTNDIGKVIWETKPAGIQTVGNTFVDIVDKFGQTHRVNFSRPTTQYVWIKIEYTKYSEELFPTDGEEKMKQACLIFGDALDINEDIIPKRFVGEIYRNVSGIDDLNVEVAITPDANIDDPNDGRLVYSSNRVEITASQVATFGTARMRVTEI